MSDYPCKSLGRSNDYCRIIISPVLCKGCPYFKKEWEDKINESQYSYCIIYEEKPMKDCPGAWFNKKKAMYECEYQKNDYSNLEKYKKCPHKTVLSYFKEKFYD